MALQDVRAHEAWVVAQVTQGCPISPKVRVAFLAGFLDRLRRTPFR